MSAPTVLLADNDEAVNGLLHGLLSVKGLNCLSVLDGAAALERLEAGGIDVLVTDLDMPKLPGLELLEHLRTMRPVPRTVVISGFIDSRLEAELKRNEVVCAILRKPFDVIEFANLVVSLARPAAGEASV